VTLAPVGIILHGAPSADGPQIRIGAFADALTLAAALRAQLGQPAGNLYALPRDAFGMTIIGMGPAGHPRAFARLLGVPDADQLNAALERIARSERARDAEVNSAPKGA
jgi:hypothetical protein